MTYTQSHHNNYNLNITIQNNVINISMSYVDFILYITVKENRPNNQDSHLIQIKGDIQSHWYLWLSLSSIQKLLKLK